MNQLTTKPTIRTTDAAAMKALRQGHNYGILSTNTGWAVWNKRTNARYQVGVDGSCTCPHAKRINGFGQTCKHFALANLSDLTKPAARTWDLKELRNGWNAPSPRANGSADAIAGQPISREARILRDFGPED